jgi:RimJ/RimL family protein N-acetyltransferase
MKYFPKLIGDLVYLSPVSTEDYGKLVEWCNDPELCEYIGTANRVIGFADMDEFIKTKADKGPFFAIITKAAEEFIGICHFTNIEQIKRMADISIFLSDLSYWNNGIGEEVANLLLDYGFNVYNMNNIAVQIYPCNEDIINCYKRCGFTIYGRRRDFVIRGRQKFDIVYMDILVEEFTKSTIGYDV